MSILKRTSSEFNKNIQIKRSLGLGTYIQVDGLTQSGGVVETVWKTSLSRVLRKKTPVKKVLILGLGGGSAAKIVNKNWPEADITGVDIDSKMVELGEKHLGLDRKILDVQIEDAEDFVAQSRQKYDLILVDMYHGYNFPKKFESEKFLKRIKKILNQTGYVVFNRLYFDKYRSMAVKFGEKLEKVFGNVEFVYPEANIMFITSI